MPMPCTVCLACALPCIPGRAGGRNTAPNRSPHASPQISGARAPRERRSLHLNHSLLSIHPQGEPLIVTLGWAATCAMFSFSLALVVWGRSGL